MRQAGFPRRRVTLRPTLLRAILCLTLLAFVGGYVWRNAVAPNDSRQTTNPAEPISKPAAPQREHPLLGEAEALVLSENIDEVPSTAGPGLAESIHALIRSAPNVSQLAPLTVDYPLDESVFPPEIVPPTFLWHDSECARRHVAGGRGFRR